MHPRSEYNRRYSKYQYQYRLEIKLAVLAKYGLNNAICCCWAGCGEKDPDVLTIDHIDNNGYVDKKLGKSGFSLHHRLKKDNFPDGFQTLCANHQLKKEVLRRREPKT